MAAPLSVPPSLYWDGNDGNWSTFWMRAGTPFQLFRLLPATSQSAVWPVWYAGCTDQDCVEARGGVFDNRDSTSWSGLQNYSFGLYTERKLGYNVSGLFGNDTVTFGSPSENLPVLDDQSVQTFEQQNFWNGFVGINNNPNLIGTIANSQPSVLQSLKTNGMIPSSSWSYTAGAFYLEPPVPGSLTLGGYDSSRLESTNVTIPFAPDTVSRDLLAPIKSISFGGSRFLLSSPIYAFIDSLVPHIWLPVEDCQAFEQALGITWNKQQQLYTLTDTQHQNLLNLNPTFTFTIAASMDNNAATVDIQLPYAALDLVGSPPWLQNATRYFPLKQATSSDQYTLGRAFLQGAMVVADYERQSFQVAQATFPSSLNGQNIVAISSPSNTTANDMDVDSKHNNGLSGGAIAGIVVCVVAVVIFFGLAVWRYRRHVRNKAEREQEQLEQQDRDRQQQLQQMQMQMHPGTDSSQAHTSIGSPPASSSHFTFSPTDVNAKKDEEIVHELEAPGGIELASPTAELASTAITELPTPEADDDTGRRRFLAKFASFRSRSRATPHELDGRAVERTP